MSEVWARLRAVGAVVPMVQSDGSRDDAALAESTDLHMREHYRESAVSDSRWRCGEFMTQPCLPSLFPGGGGSEAPEPKPNPVAVEKRRLNAAARRVLAWLQSHEVATNVTLSSPSIGGLRFGGRLKELRDDGWLIETAHIKGGRFLYRLKGRK